MPCFVAFVGSILFFGIMKISHTFASTYFWFVKDEFGLILGVYKGVLLTCGNCMKSLKNIIFNPQKVEVMKIFIF
jgi:hypothetical protein